MLLRNIDIIREEINEYVTHADDSMLREIHSIIEAEQAGDWWNEISDVQKVSIQKGIKDMQAGNSVSHNEMVKMYSNWLTK